MVDGSSHKYHIFIADDDENTRIVMQRLAKTILVNLGKNKDEYVFHLCEDGQEAFDQIMDLNSDEAKRAILITDAKMPALSGLELVQRLRGSRAIEFQELPVIYMTGTDGKIPNDYRALSFISKPVEWHEAEPILKNYIDLIDKKLQVEKETSILMKLKQRQAEAAVGDATVLDMERVPQEVKAVIRENEASRDEIVKRMKLNEEAAREKAEIYRINAILKTSLDEEYAALTEEQKRIKASESLGHSTYPESDTDYLRKLQADAGMIEPWLVKKIKEKNKSKNDPLGNER